MRHPDRDRRCRLLAIDRPRQATVRGSKPAHRQSRHRRSSRQLVAGLGHRTCNRRLARCGGRLYAAFLASAASAAIALATLALVRARPIRAEAAHASRRKPTHGGPAIALAFAALALFYTAMFLGSIPLPIVLTTTLSGANSDVGVAMSLCAGLEIVVMGALIWRPLQRGERAAIIAGFAAFVAYFIALSLARSVGAVLWAQILRAIGIALVTYLGIGFLHSLLPHRAAPPRRCSRTPASWARSLRLSASAGWRMRLAMRPSSWCAPFLARRGLVLICLTPPRAS